MEDDVKKRYSSKKTVIFSLIVLFIVQVVLNCDFWNWGVPDTYYFEWMTPEYLWRMFLLFVISPLSYYFIIRFAWPLPDKEEQL